MILLIPLDTCLRYFFKVKKLSDELSGASVLQTIARTDEADREMWVEHHRNGALSLGQVIRKVSEIRDASWQPPEIVKVGT